MTNTSSRFLRDSNYNIVMDQLTHGPMRVPSDWNPQASLAFAREIGPKRSAALSRADPWAYEDVLKQFGSYFTHGSPGDLQRTYNSTVNGAFQGEFTNAAAYNFGMAGAAAGFTFDELKGGAGAYNYYNRYFKKNEKDKRGNPHVVTDIWSFGNAPERVVSMRQGFDDYKAGKWRIHDAFFDRNTYAGSEYDTGLHPSNSAIHGYTLNETVNRPDVRSLVDVSGNPSDEEMRRDGVPEDQIAEYRQQRDEHDRVMRELAKERMTWPSGREPER